MIKRILISLAVVAFALPLVGFLYQEVLDALDQRRLPPPGKLVDVDGHRMHIHCQGSGSPTVVIEQGIGALSLSWAVLNQQLSTITTVCAYDRVGMGYSEPVDHPTPATEVASNLHKLLEAAGITDGIVLVGWSAGGMYAREYYRQHPDEVRGMVLVDSSHEQQTSRMPPPKDEAFNPIYRDQYLARIGWIRATSRAGDFKGLPKPPEVRDRMIALKLQSHYYATLVAEGEGFKADLAANRAPPKLGDLPLIVISEGKPNDPFMAANLATWHVLQQELVELSTNGRHIVATKSAHGIHRTEPELIQRAVEEVVAAARTRVSAGS